MRWPDQAYRGTGACATRPAASFDCRPRATKARGRALYLGMTPARYLSPVVAALLLVALAACSKASKPERAAAHERRCFHVVATDNSPSTRAVFEAKRCQGGGVTWAAILDALVRRRGTSEPIEDEVPGWTGDVRTLSWNGDVARFAIDDEGDEALFCTDSDRLLQDVQADVKRLNGRAAELEGAMGEADPLALECFSDDSAVAKLLGRMARPPEPSGAEARWRDEHLARLRAVLAAHRTWCWRPSGKAFGAAGGLTLQPDGRVTAFDPSGASIGGGRWKLEQEGRVEIIGDTAAVGLHYFDVEDSGHLGFNHSAGREELDACEVPAGSK